MTERMGGVFLPSYVHGREMTRSSSLENDAYHGYPTSRPDKNRPTSKPISGLGREEGANETACLECRDNIRTEI